MKRCVWCSVWAALLGLCACTTTSALEKQASHAVAFRELKNYFVRNDVPDGASRQVLRSQVALKESFGMAAIMEPKGQPSRVDFEADCVLAIVAPKMKRDCTLEVREVVKEEGRMYVRYCQTLGAPLTYTIRSCLLLAVPQAEVPSELVFQCVDGSF